MLQVSGIETSHQIREISEPLTNGSGRIKYVSSFFSLPACPNLGLPDTKNCPGGWFSVGFQVVQRFRNQILRRLNVMQGVSVYTVSVPRSFLRTVSQSLVSVAVQWSFLGTGK